MNGGSFMLRVRGSLNSRIFYLNLSPNAIYEHLTF